jgi:Raf kinase inhibitor-like YbhB/YbcL family protein
MPKARPGSNAYDIERARLRKHLEDSGQAVDSQANELANKILQEERGQAGVFRRSDRGQGPLGSGGTSGEPSHGKGIMLRSWAFSDNDMMPDRLSRIAGNVSPPLEWTGTIENAEELVLLCEDPDGRRPQPFLHWLVTGIDPAATATGEGEVPGGGREWPNGFGDPGYDGPMPLEGDPLHRYFFRLYAVSEPLSLPQHPEVEDVKRAVEPVSVASGVLIGLFGR